MTGTSGFILLMRCVTLECVTKRPKGVGKLTFIKWTSIELLHNVKRDLDTAGKAFQITYRAKIKLHGTNAGIRVTSEGEVVAQKRTQIITSKNDNAGFAGWVEQNTEYFSREHVKHISTSEL